MPLPLLTEQSVVAAKLEGTYGTAESLTTAEAAMNIFDADFNPDGAITQRQGQSALSPLAGVPGAVMNKAKFKSYLYGDGASDPPLWTLFLQASGMAVSTATFTPQTGSATAKSITLAQYLDGNVYKLSGAMGNWTLDGEAGMPCVFSWEFTGKYEVDAAVAILAPTYPTTIPPVFMGSTLTIGGVTHNITKFSISPNNTVDMRECGNDSSNAPKGYLGAHIPKRRYTMKVTAEAVLQSTKDWRALYIAGTTAALVLTIGSASHNTHSFTAPVMQLNAIPQMTDDNGKQMVELTYDLCRSAAAGDDEFQLVES